MIVLPPGGQNNGGGGGLGETPSLMLEQWSHLLILTWVLFLLLKNSEGMSIINAFFSLFSPFSLPAGVKALILLASGVFEELKADSAWSNLSFCLSWKSWEYEVRMSPDRGENGEEWIKKCQGEEEYSGKAGRVHSLSYRSRGGGGRQVL